MPHGRCLTNLNYRSPKSRIVLIYRNSQEGFYFFFPLIVASFTNGMARHYQAGDIVDCNFPYQDNPTKWEKRPGLILRVDSSISPPYFLIAKITSTNNSHYITGKWVLANSKTGKRMRLDNDSFIHLENIARVPLFAIRRLRGECDCMPELFELCKGKNIAY